MQRIRQGCPLRCVCVPWLLRVACRMTWRAGAQARSLEGTTSCLAVMPVRWTHQLPLPLPQPPCETARHRLAGAAWTCPDRPRDPTARPRHRSAQPWSCEEAASSQRLLTLPQPRPRPTRWRRKGDPSGSDAAASGNSDAGAGAGCGGAGPLRGAVAPPRAPANAFPTCGCRCGVRGRRCPPGQQGRAQARAQRPGPGQRQSQRRHRTTRAVRLRAPRQRTPLRTPPAYGPRRG